MRKRKTRNLREKWVLEELAAAREQWAGRLDSSAELWLCALLRRTQLRVSRRELLLIDGVLYVSHAGLLALARRQGCAGIQSEVVAELSRPEERRWVVQARVFKSHRSVHSFTALGDADPNNVSSRVRGSELRVAETRAVNRALRKAYGVGICSVEEIGGGCESRWNRSNASDLKQSLDAVATHGKVSAAAPSLQDRLKLILREHQLDPEQVLAYGRRFLGVADFNQASPEAVARFVAHLEQFAIANRAWLAAELSRNDSTTEQMDAKEAA